MRARRPNTAVSKLQSPRYSTMPNLFRSRQAGGNSLLHNLVRSYQNIHEFQLKIRQFSQYEMLKMSLTINDEGKTPLDLVIADGPKQLRKLLYDILANQRHRRLTDPVRIFYAKKPSQDLHKTLLLGRLLATAARKAILTSSTHPQTNYYSYAESQAIEKKVSDTILRMSFEPRSEDIMQNHALTAAEFQAGNCQHFSALVCYELQKLNLNYDFAMYGITNGNHVFSVLNEKCAPEENAVIVDAWRGTVFPRQEIKNLGVYKYYQLNEGENGIRKICKYNPNFHVIQMMYSSHKDDMQKRLQP